MLKRALPLACASLLAAGNAHAAPEDRDLDGDTVAGAFYDTDLDITWLRDANVNGALNWETAASWVANFNLGAYGAWRLPAATLGCSGYDSCSSEMGHLSYVELGNSAGALIDAGGFQNLLPAIYWTGTVYPGYPSGAADVFDPSNGTHSW